MKVGQKAPDFRLSDRTGKKYSVKDFLGQYTVLFFYPKDDTPGCTIESKAFSADLPKYAKIQTQVVGISGGTDKTKEAFCKKYGLKQLMLSDTDYSVSKKYGAYGKKVFMGRTYTGVLRQTYVLDPSGKVISIFNKVKPETHSDEVLKLISQLSKLTGNLKKGVSGKSTTTKGSDSKMAKKTKKTTTKTTKTTMAPKKTITKVAKAGKPVARKTTTTAKTKKATPVTKTTKKTTARRKSARARA